MDRLRHEKRADEREFEQPGVGLGAAGGSLAPADEGDQGEHDRDDGHDAPNAEGELRGADQKLGGSGHLAAERAQERLEARQEKREEKKDDAARDENHEHRVGERRHELGAQFALLDEVGDETGERVVEGAGGFAGLDEIDRAGIEDLGIPAKSAGKRRAFADAFPDAGAERAEAGFLDAGGEKAHGFAGGQAAAGEIVECLEERKTLRAAGRLGVEAGRGARRARHLGGSRRGRGGRR